MRSKYTGRRLPGSSTIFSRNPAATRPLFQMRLLRSVKTQFCHKKAQLFLVVPSVAKPTIVVCVAAPANRAQPTWSSDSQFIYFLLPWDDPGVFRVRVSGGNAERVTHGRSTFGWP